MSTLAAASANASPSPTSMPGTPREEAARSPFLAPPARPPRPSSPARTPSLSGVGGGEYFLDANDSLTISVTRTSASSNGSSVSSVDSDDVEGASEGGRERARARHAPSRQGSFAASGASSRASSAGTHAAAPQQAKGDCCASKAKSGPAASPQDDGAGLAQPKAGCCSMRSPPSKATAQSGTAAPSRSGAPAWPMSTAAIAGGGAAQHAHLFVEGCTCGAGIVGCCPCALGAGAHGGMQGMNAYGEMGGMGAYGSFGDVAQTWSGLTLAVGSGALSAVGIYFGVRAFVLNGQAGRRVRESLDGVRQSARQAQRLEAARTALSGEHEPLLRGAPATAWQWLTRARRRYDQLERRLHGSLRERRFERWVPGALQASASLGVLLTALPIPALMAFHPVLMPATALLWAAFGAAYACAAAASAVQEHRRYRAMAHVQRVAAAAIDEENQSHERAKSQAKTQLSLAVGQFLAWTSFALGTAALALPGVVGPLLGATAAPLWTTAIGAGLAATWLSASARRPQHQLTSPATLAMPIDGTLTPLVQAESALIEQRRALADYVGPARTGHGAQAASLRFWMAFEQTFLPQCGPKAYGAVAARAERAEATAGEPAGQPLGERALARTIVRCIDAELRLLQAWQPAGGKDDGELQATSSAELQASGMGEEGRVLVDAAAAVSSPERTQAHGRRQRREQLQALHAQWQTVAQGEPLVSVAPAAPADHDPTMLGDDLRLATLMVFGLLGERLAAQPPQQPPLVTTMPHYSPLPFLQQTPVIERWPLLAHALRQRIRSDFVRLFCNPHRIDEALWAARTEMATLAARGPDAAPASVASAPTCAQCE